MKKIGPYFHVSEPYNPRMADALSADLELGSHHLNNLSSEQFAKQYPTISAMALLVDERLEELEAEHKQQKERK